MIFGFSYQSKVFVVAYAQLARASPRNITFFGYVILCLNKSKLLFYPSRKSFYDKCSNFYYEKSAVLPIALCEMFIFNSGVKNVLIAYSLAWLRLLSQFSIPIEVSYLQIKLSTESSVSF